MYDRLLYFSDLYFANKAEMLFIEYGLKIQLIPTPEQLSHACGICILLLKDDLTNALELMRKHHISWTGVYVYINRKERLEKLHIKREP